MAPTYKPGKEINNNYQIDAVVSVIKKKQALGEDASFEIGLLESWKYYPGWEYAGKVLQEFSSSKRVKSKNSGIKAQSKVKVCSKQKNKQLALIGG